MAHPLSRRKGLARTGPCPESACDGVISDATEAHVAPAQPPAETREVGVGLNTRSYSGINAAVRFGGFDEGETGREAFLRAVGRASRRSQKRHHCPEDRPGLLQRRKEPARHTTFSCCFPAPLLLLIQCPNACCTNHYPALAHSQELFLLLIRFPRDK